MVDVRCRDMFPDRKRYSLRATKGPGAADQLAKDGPHNALHGAWHCSLVPLASGTRNVIGFSETQFATVGFSYPYEGTLSRSTTPSVHPILLSESRALDAPGSEPPVTPVCNRENRMS